MSFAFPRWTPPVVGKYVLREVMGDNSCRGLRGRKNEALGRGDEYYADELQRREKCLLRLAGIDDDRMQEAYQYLAAVGVKQDSLVEFIECAVACDVDFDAVRQEIAIRDAFTSHITSLAAQLATALDEGPPQMRSAFDLGIRGLLLRTDCPSIDLMQNQGNFPELIAGKCSRNEIWQSNRDRVLGGGKHDPNYLLVSVWSNAPTLADCLRTLEKDIALAGRTFSSEEAAVGRQKNSKTEYIRAFAGFLADGISAGSDPVVESFSWPVLKAMAITATVVKDHPDLDYSAKEVKQAIDVAGITPAPEED